MLFDDGVMADAIDSIMAIKMSISIPIPFPCPWRFPLFQKLKSLLLPDQASGALSYSCPTSSFMELPLYHLPIWGSFVQVCLSVYQPLSPGFDFSNIPHAFNYDNQDKSMLG